MRRYDETSPSVLIPLPLPEAFDYAEPEGMGLAVGDVVAAPLGPRLVRGVVTGLRDGAGGNRALKAVAGRIETPPLPAESLAFIELGGALRRRPAGPAAGDRAARLDRAEGNGPSGVVAAPPASRRRG